MADTVHRPSADETVLSCPACWEWQLHYDAPALIAQGIFRDETELDFIVERLLREHVAHDCAQPVFFAKLARIKGVI